MSEMSVADPRLSKWGCRPSCYPWICQCTGMQTFLNSFEL